MATRRAITAKGAPAPNPLMSQAIVCDQTVYCSGSLGIDPATGKLVEGCAYSRTKQSLSNLKVLLEAAGSSLEKVVKVNIFLSNMEAYGKVNEAYAEMFISEPKPCRTCVVVAELPMKTDVEIECIASLS